MHLYELMMAQELPFQKVDEEGERDGLEKGVGDAGREGPRGSEPTDRGSSLAGSDDMVGDIEAVRKGRESGMGVGDVVLAGTKPLDLSRISKRDTMDGTEAGADDYLDFQ